MPTETVDKHPGLQRMVYEQQGVACYRVKMLRQGSMFQEYFAFKRYRNEAAALAEAKKCWREISQAFPRLSRRDLCEVERRRSPSGMVGIARIVKVSNGREYAFWRANFTDRTGSRRVRSFSVDKYGDAEAKRLAVKARRDALAQLGQ